MIEKKEEGIVLSALNYKESSRIISVFTPREGVIKLIAKRLSKSKPTWINLTTPLCRGQFIYQVKRSSLYSFVDGHILDLHLSLRNSYLHIQEAGKMLRALSLSQLQGKPAPLLYHLLLSYLDRFPTFSSPKILASSFLLKILKHDGLLSLSSDCLRCKKLPSYGVEKGESLCRMCSSRSALSFSKEDFTTLCTLLEARQFASLTSLPISSSLSQSIEDVFHHVIG